jgi:type IV fimbrial biogenesis protein FimT
MPRGSGFTVWELLFTLLVVGVIVGWGVPSLRTWILGSRQTADINAFVTAVQLARSEAAKRRRDIVLCKTRDLTHCGTDDVSYTAGWMVFVDADGRRPPQRAASERLLYAHRPQPDARITSNRASYEFRPFRRRSTNGTVTFCDARGDDAARAVIISYTGRPRVAPRGPGGRRLRCADFP